MLQPTNPRFSLVKPVVHHRLNGNVGVAKGDCGYARIKFWTLIKLKL